ncbi:MAG: PilN domain-containing protein [bacterium]
MIKINLLSEKGPPIPKVLNQLLVGFFIILAVCTLLVLLYMNKQQQVQTLRGQVEDLKAKQKEYKDVEENIKKLEKTEAKLEKKMKSINELQEGREFFIKVLNKVSESVPPNQVWLNSIEYNGERGGDVKVKGTSYDKDAVAVFMGNLAIIPCDDEKDVKHPVCIERNQACLKPERERNSSSNSPWQHSECKVFYDHKEEELNEMKEWRKNQPNCKSECKAINCSQAENVSRCERNKEECIKSCEEKLEKLRKLEAEYKKLHEKEYIVYDSIKLDYIRADKGRKGATSRNYQFSLKMKAAK